MTSAGGAARAIRPAHGRRDERSRVCAAMDARKAAVQIAISESMAGFCAFDQPRASSSSVCALCARSLNRRASPDGVDGGWRSAPATASMAFPNAACSAFNGLRSPGWICAASRTSARLSSSPAAQSRFTIGPAALSRQALARAIRCPARLPLSTDETYFGSSARKSCVAYQL